jgi:phosphatidylglycerophosphate synthase
MKDKPWDARLACKLVYPLRNSWLTPNHLTSLRLLFGILAATGLSTGDYFWTNIGALCFVISNFLDHSDGELARLTGKMSTSGHYFDLASDAIVNIILFIGIGIGLMHSQLGYWALFMGTVSGLAIAGIFHMRNKIEKSIGKSGARQPNIGIIEAEDVLYLLPIVTFMGWLVPFLILATVGAPVFALWTMKEYRDLRTKQS